MCRVLSPSVATMLLLMLLTVSCGKNPCKDIDCGPHGSCEKGICECDKGYTLDGDSTCNQKISSLITGVYQPVVTGCNTGSYELVIQGSNVFDDVLILVNLGGYTCDNGDDIIVEGLITSPESFILEEARYCDQYQVSGSGTITETSIIIEYSVSYGSESTGELVEETCKLTLPRA